MTSNKILHVEVDVSDIEPKQLQQYIDELISKHKQKLIEEKKLCLQLNANNDNKGILS